MIIVKMSPTALFDVSDFHCLNALSQSDMDSPLFMNGVESIYTGIVPVPSPESQQRRKKPIIPGRHSFCCAVTGECIVPNTKRVSRLHCFGTLCTPRARVRDRPSSLEAFNQAPTTISFTLRKLHNKTSRNLSHILASLSSHIRA